MNNISILRGSIIFITVFLYSLSGISQRQQDPKIQNPNAASLGVFGEIPLSLYTGTPNISIPIHTLSYGKIEVPIILKYHPSSVKPSVQPGWVGLGWNLESYGRITRTKRGPVDEMFFPNQTYGGLQGGDTYYPAPSPAYNGTGSSGSEKVNISNWDAVSTLKDYFTIGSPQWPTSRNFLDVEADEFSFNVGNYSGKFYYTGLQNGWQVVSSDPIKVELNDFFTSSEIFSALDDYLLFNASFPLIDNQGAQSRMFRGFTLTVPNGTKYVFGGSDAVEFSCPYGTNLKSFNADNWLLKKIIDVNGNEVSFEYRRSYPTVNLFFGQTDFYYTAYTSSNFWQCSSGSTFSNATVNTKKHSGILQWSMYLNKIICPSESIEFEASVANCLRYTDIQLTRIDETGQSFGSNLFDLSLLGTNKDDPANVNNLQWEKLDWVIIKNAKQDIIKKYSFGYQLTTGTGQRLTLNNLTELSAATFANGTYTFTYNAVADLPMYVGDYTDHWGFYNNRTVQGASLTQIISNNTKETDTNYVTKGVLTSIKYPTGGSTAFTWEPHDYSAMVSLTRNSLEAATGYAGGSRVSRIQNFSPEGVLLSEKKYYYKKNYYSGAVSSSLVSSGVLNGRPKYYFSITNRLGYDGSAKYNIEYVSLNSLSTYSYNAQGSYIGYDEVVEVNTDGSYTKNFFTNYGADLNGVPHYDKQPSLIGWQPSEDPYLPMNSLELERGLPVAINKYSSTDILTQKKIITYRNDEGRFNSFVKRIDFNSPYACIPGGNGALVLAVARKEYNYFYYPIKTEIIDYDADGKNPISNVAISFYNSYNMLSQKEEADSRGVKQITTYKYPFDFTTDATLTAMVNAHILSPVVETSKTVSIPVSTPLMLTRTNFYSPYSGIFVPSNIQQQKGTNPIETIQQFNQYDQRGNLLETQKVNDVKEVYLWGYNSQYPVAKVIGSDFNTVQSFISQLKLNNAELTYTDEDIRTELQKIRTGLKSTEALVTTYTYKPLIGMTSETDPNGRTTFYEYDSFNRLKLIRDKDGNVIKTFEYHYKQ